MKHTIAITQQIHNTSIAEFKKIVDGKRFLIFLNAYWTKTGLSPHQKDAVVFKGIEGKGRTSSLYLELELFKSLSEDGFTVHILQD